MAYMEGLGRDFDLSAGAAVQNLGVVGGVTGKRVSLKNCSGVSVVVYKGAGTGGQDPVLSFYSATAATGGSLTPWPTPSGTDGTPQYYYKKSANTLAGNESWTKVTTTATGGTVTLTGEGGKQGIYVFPINPSDLNQTSGGVASGFADYLEVDIGSVAATQQVSVLFIQHDLNVQRDPTKQANSQA